MERVTITIDEALLASIDRLAERKGYASRSEAVRDLVRDAVDRKRGRCRRRLRRDAQLCL